MLVNLLLIQISLSNRQEKVIIFHFLSMRMRDFFVKLFASNMYFSKRKHKQSLIETCHIQLGVRCMPSNFFCSNKLDFVR